MSPMTGASTSATMSSVTTSEAAAPRRVSVLDVAAQLRQGPLADLRLAHPARQAGV